MHRNSFSHFVVLTAFFFVFLFTAKISIADTAPAPIGTEKQVIDRFWDILRRSPRRGTTFERVYGYYADTGHTDLLLEQCRTLAEKDPKDAKARMLLGLVLERRGDPEHAAKAFEAATRLDEKDPLAPFYLGENLVVLGRLRDGIDALEESMRRKPSRVDVRIVLQALGRAYERFGEPQKSADVWKRLETLFPDDPELLVQIAETLESEGRLDEALDYFDRLAAKTTDEFARVRFTLAAVDIRIRRNENQNALDALNTLLDRLAPESWPAESVREKIDRIFVRQNDLPGLAAFYRNRLEKNPVEAEAARRLSITLRRIEQGDEARKILEEVLAKTPSNIPLRLTLIDLLIDRKENAAAAEQFRELDRLRPNNVDFLTRWGQTVLDDSGRDETVRKTEALEIWQRIAVGSNAADPVAAVTLADLLLRNRFYDEAERYYRQAVQLRPDDAAYREYLAQFYHARREKEKVLDALRPIAEGNRRTAETLSQLGVLLMSMGYAEESFEPFRDAAELAPDDLPTRWRYIEALLRQGDMDTAAGQIQDVERQIENDDRFDDFLQQEVRFLQSVRKLDAAIREVEHRLAEKIDADQKTAARSWWRLAVYHQAEVETRAAAEAVEKAVAIPNPSPRLLRTAAEIFERNGDFEKAIGIYESLIQVDGIWRVEHLKRLAPLQIRVGRMDQALETGRVIMGLGSGNAANIRFYADLLLGLGRRDEAVGILRQALRVEPGNTSTLALLAETLADAGREDEAIEIAWRLFERTENLSGRLGLVEKLCGYYQRAGRFDDLADRLQTRLSTVEEKQEAVLCLARAFATTAQFEQARRTLETGLDIPVREGGQSAATELLRELVSVAEKQDDLAAAVEFQERLLRRTRHPADADRLFVLYDRIGETEKAVDLFLQRVLQQGTLEEKLGGIDRMIAREQYDAVLRVLEFIEIHENATWRISFRRMAVESYLGEYSVAEMVDEFRKLPFPVTVSPGDRKTPVFPRDGGFRLAPPQPWLLPGTNFSRLGLPPDPESFEWTGTAPDEFLEALYVQEQFLPTLFRNLLRKNDRFTSTGSAEPPKPFYRVETFADARFLTLAWRLKEAIDEDLKEPGRNFEHFRTQAESLRNELSADDPEPAVRLERLRLEAFLVSLSRLDEGRNALAGGRLKAEVDREISRRTVRKIIRRLGLEGVVDWQAATLLILLDEMLDRRIAARFDGSDYQDKLAGILDENLRRRGVDGLPDPIRREMLRNADQRIRRAAETRHGTENEIEQLDRLLELWRKAAGDPATAERFVTNIAVRLPEFFWLLETTGWKDRAERLRQALEDPVTIIRLAPSVSLPFDEDIALFPTLPGFDSVETQVGRMMPWLLRARNSGRKTGDAESRRTIFETEMKTLATLFTADRFHGIFSEQEAELIATPVESLRDLLNPNNLTPSSHFARRLLGLEEHEETERRTITDAQAEQIAGLARTLDRITEFSFVFPDVPVPAEQSPESVLEKTETFPRPLSNYLPELTGTRTVDRSLLRSVLQGREFFAPLSPFEELLFRIAVLCRALDTTLQNVDQEVDGQLQPVPAGYVDRFRTKLDEQEKAAGSAADRRTVADLRDVLAEVLWPDAAGSDAAFLRLAERLETYHLERSDRPDAAAMLASALLKARAKRFDEVMPVLDAIPLKTPQDIRSREFVAAQLGAGTPDDSPRRKRGNVALDRLSGYRLSGREGFQLLLVLEIYDRRDEARTVLDRLVATSNDRQLQMLLLDKLRTPRPDEREVAVRLARRVLRNPAFFSDPRYFSNDAHIYASALNLLKEYDTVDTVVDGLEARYKGLRDKIDGAIMLVELYAVIGRKDQARELLDELAREFPQKPGRDPHRRQAITKLLQQFGMRKELGEMNERMLAPMHREP